MPRRTPSARNSARLFEPFVSPTENRPELTTRALVLGCIFGLLFGAVTVYVGLRAGLTVGASIPIAVLSISLLRAFGRASILENNIVQTTGNSGQSIASGVIFTLPALIFLGFDLEYSRIFLLALLGGLLGVLFMIPLRRQLIVEEHGRLTYPEGTACADVLLAGERGGSFAGRVFLGLGLGGLYTLFQNENLFGAWPGTPDYQPQWLKGSAIRADVTPEYLGVGYIIGPRIAGLLFAGGIFSWLVLMPAIYFFGSHFPQAIYPGTKPIAQMSPSDLWASYVRPMGAGAVAASGLITLIKTMPTIVGALRAAMGNLRPGGGVEERSAAHRRRSSFQRGGWRVAGPGVDDVFLSHVQTGAGRAGELAGQPRGCAAGGFLRISIRNCLLPHRGADRQLFESCLGYDDRHADGDIRDFSGERMDGSRVRRPGHHHWRRGVHRGGQCGRYLAGSQDRVS